MNLRRIALAAGLIIALALVGVWLGRMLQPEPHHGGAELHALIHGELDLDQKQKQELTVLERQFAARRQALEDRLRRSNMLLGKAIGAEHEYGPRVSAAVEDTHDAMGDLQKETLEHVFAMRAILRPDQQTRFDAVVSESLAAQPQ